jgi:hypothetical protein
VSDYRDDRPVLRARVAELEAEVEQQRQRAQGLEQAAARTAALEIEAQQLRGRVEQLTAPRRQRQRAWVVLGAVGAAFVMALGIIGALLGTRVQPPPPPPPIAAGPTPLPPEPAKPRPWQPRYELSATCRCAKSGDSPEVALGFTTGASVSMGGATTYSVLATLSPYPALGERRELPLGLGPTTAPPAKLDGGAAELLMACLPDRVVFAHAHRVTAWSRADGSALWNATLPAPVGDVQRGALSLSCKPIEPGPKGKVVIPTAAGRTVLDAATGRPGP